MGKGEDKELLLIGTVHGDPDGMVRLLALLRKEEPDLVAVEVSPYGLAYRRTHSRRLQGILGRRVRRASDRHGVSWKEWGQIQAIFGQLSFPFEYRACLRFCRDSGARFRCVDLSPTSRHLIHASWDELLSSSNIETLLRRPPEHFRTSVRKAYAMASKLVAEKEKGYLSAFLRAWERNPVWKRREAALAQRIQKQYEVMNAGRLAYVGGWQHLLHPTDAGTLCDRISHLNPRRVLLADPLAL